MAIWKFIKAVNKMINGGEGSWQRYQPLIGNRASRLLLGLAVVIGSSYLIALNNEIYLWRIIPTLLLAWAISVWLTDKYRHKYPQKYFTYLLASHGKACLVMAGVLFIIHFFKPNAYSIMGVYSAAVILTVVDFLLSVPRIRIKKQLGLMTVRDKGETKIHPQESVDTVSIGRKLAEAKELMHFEGLAQFVREALTHNETGMASLSIIDTNKAEGVDKVALLLQIKSMNSVRRLNNFLAGVPAKVIMGGYFIFSYKPMDEFLEALKKKKKGLGYAINYSWHFIWHRAIPRIRILEKIYFSKLFSWLDSWIYQRRQENRRVIARAEMWGRIYYWGFDVLAERRIGPYHWVITKRVQEPETTLKPSFYLIARLIKVGLNGKPLYLHKLRTMYPFSEFLQKKIQKDHGLLNTGKYRDDFRITDYGKVMRRYWLDELPQIWDWLRGDIKLVGMRATSPQFLNLYSQEFYDLYINIKPGLIPPIFSSTTRGFDDIVRIELDYLRAYQLHPIATDIRYFFKTINDIIVRGTRSN